MSAKPKIVLFQCQWCLFAPADQEWVDQRLPQVIRQAVSEQFGSIGEPGLSLKTGTGAAATEQQAMQLGRRNGLTAAGEQGGESGVRGILSGHRNRYLN